MTVAVDRVADVLRRRLPGVGVLKLHKLLYYCQGHHLSGVGEPLFAETISAWDNGPVVGELWYRENQQLPAPEVVSGDKLTEAEMNTIGYVISRYGGLTGSDLIRLTHEERPWAKANGYRQPGSSVAIPHDDMREFFQAEAAVDGDTVLIDHHQLNKWLAHAVGNDDSPAEPDDPQRLHQRLSEARVRVAR